MARTFEGNPWSKVKRMINGRYHLHHEIGKGGMSVVYLATDRLTNQQVALKQIKLPRTQFSYFASHPVSEFEKELKLALAHEFQTVASLRHPYIISVLNYGFDQTGNPFFTMPYLAEAQPFLEKGRAVSIPEKLSLIYKLIQALVYLHQRDIVHRDLKPTNILITDTAFKVLDFGLSVSGENQKKSSSAGTPSYLAPEIWYENGYSCATDMFAAGILAFQLLAVEQTHPFAPIDHLFMDRVLEKEPDWSLLQCDPEVTILLKQLLEKDPQQRVDAPTALRQLSSFISHEQAETPEIRESYLQYATFVGRKKEKRQLSKALQQAKKGRGSSILVGGESGVGKSRLLNEIRIEALVNQVTVVRGRAVQGGGSPYKIWHETIRPLLLSATYHTPSFHMFKRFVPDYEQLLNELPLGETKHIASKPTLVDAVIDLIRAQSQPVLLLVEDLHWAEVSLDLLNQVAEKTATLPLLIIGTYRDEEQHDLNDQLSNMSLMRLSRLSHSETIQLSRAILGKQIPTALTQLLFTETEGNTLFVVETIRALAQQAGKLSDIQKMQLPSHVLAGGVMSVLQQRLAPIPTTERRLLEIAAIAGRQVDLRLLAHTTSDIDEKEWTHIVMHSGLFDVSDNQWLFAHDKLRQMLINQLSSKEKQDLHRQVAIAYETAYPNEGEYALQIVTHWQQANDDFQVWQHVLPAIKYLLQISAFREAQQLIKRVLEMIPNVPVTLKSTQMQLLYETARASLQLGDMPRAIKDGLKGLEIANQSSDLTGQAQGYIFLGRAFWMDANIKKSEFYTQTGLKLARQVESVSIMAEALWLLCVIYRHLDFVKAGAYYQRALAINREHNSILGIARTLNSMGLLEILRGNYAQAQKYHEESLALSRQIGNRVNIVTNLNNLGLVERYGKSYELAQKYHEESLEVSYEIAYIHGVGANLNNLGLLAFDQNRLADALDLLQKALTVRREIQEQRGIINTLGHLGRVYVAQKNLDEAQAVLFEGLRLAIDYGVVIYILQMLASMVIWCGEHDDIERATRLSGFVQTHPLASQETQDIVWDYQAVLRQKQPLLLWEQRLNEGEQWDLMATAKRLLQILEDLELE